MDCSIKPIHKKTVRPLNLIPTCNSSCKVLQSRESENVNVTTLLQHSCNICIIRVCFTMLLERFSDVVPSQTKHFSTLWKKKILKHGCSILVVGTLTLRSVTLTRTFIEFPQKIFRQPKIVCRGIIMYWQVSTCTVNLPKY